MQRHELRVGFKGTNKCVVLVSKYLVNLGVYAVPEQHEVVVAVNAFDVDCKRLDDLEVGVRIDSALHSDFDGLVRTFHYFEVAFHSLNLEQSYSES